MNVSKLLEFRIDKTPFVFRNIDPHDVTEKYTYALEKEGGRIQGIPADINITKQMNYIQKVLRSPWDTIFGLFLESRLIGTAGVQNILSDKKSNRPIKMANGYTHNCTIGIFIIDKTNRGLGYGKTLIWASCNLIYHCRHISVFKACIEKDNIPSIKSFLSCGFTIEAESDTSLDVSLKIDRLKCPEFIEDVRLKNNSKLNTN